jgi:anti-anti-sigma regulatory factor
MTARITEQDEPSGHVIRLEGSLSGEDARLVERLCAEAASRPDPRVVVDLNGVTFLDDESAAVLRRLRGSGGVTFRGCCLFNQRVIDGAK